MVDNSNNQYADSLINLDFFSYPSKRNLKSFLISHVILSSVARLHFRFLPISALIISLVIFRQLVLSCVRDFEGRRKARGMIWNTSHPR